MTHERQQGHAAAKDSSRDEDDDALDPGRISRSALMRRPDKAIVSGIVQRKARDDNGVAEGAEHAVAAASSSSGSPLPSGLMRKFEESLGADLSAVRVHTGESSAVANDAVGAKAYTMGTDIHFGAGHYDPSSPAGEHLLAHEVAHTVQQSGGAQRMQFKLAVSSPGDHHETEADAAADAMVAGRAAQVGSASGLARQAGPMVAGGDITFELAEQSLPATPAGPFKISPHFSGSISLKPVGGADGGTPATVGVTMGKDKVKLSAEKEFGPETWTIKPKLVGEAEIKDGKPKLSVGIGIAHPGVSLKGVQFGPVALTGTAFEWEAGATKPKIAQITGDVSVSTVSEGSWQGYKIAPSMTVGITVEPNWEEIGEWIAEQAAAAIASGAAGAAAAIAAPLIAAAGMLYAWSKAGHEFDEVHKQIENLRISCEIAANEAMTGKHTKVMMLGKDLNASTTSLANEIRAAVSEQLKIPEGAFPAAAKAKPGIRTLVYQTAWGKTWPGLKAKLLEAYQDTTFTSFKFERQWLESFDSGDFSKG